MDTAPSYLHFSAINLSVREADTSPSRLETEERESGGTGERRNGGAGERGSGGMEERRSGGAKPLRQPTAATSPVRGG